MWDPFKTSNVRVSLWMLLIFINNDIYDHTNQFCKNELNLIYKSKIVSMYDKRGY